MDKHKEIIIRAVTAAQSVGFFTGLIPELKEMGYEVIAVSSDGPQLKEVENVGGRAIPVNMERRMAPLKDLKALYKLIKVFRKEKPTMVHSMTPKAGLLCMMAAKLTKVPVRVHTFTGLVFPTSTGLRRKILMTTDRLTCACATHIIPEGEGVKNDLLNNGITKKPINVLGYGNCMGIDLKYFNTELPEIVKEAGSIRKSGVFTFSYVGRIVGDKGINELVEAFAKLFSERQDIRLILIGREESDLDPVKNSTKNLIRECQGIEAVGQQNDVRPWLLASDVFILPSYREGFPNVVIEAGAMGLPSIVTNINGSREIIIEGKNGTIVPSKDSEALYQAMKYFIDNPEKIKEMADNARPLIAQRYEQSFVRQCLKDYYREILNRSQDK